MPVPTPWRAALYTGAAGLVFFVRWMVRTYRLLPAVLMLSMGAQGCIIVGIPAGVLFIRWNNRKSAGKDGKDAEPPQSSIGLPRLSTLLCFLVGVISWLLVTNAFEELQLWKAAAVLQCVAYAVVATKVASGVGSVAGISTRKFFVDMLGLACRVAAVSLSGFRLPRGAGDDPLVSLADRCALGLVAAIVLGLLVRRQQAELLDDFGIDRWTLGVGAVALVFRMHLGPRPLPSLLWTASQGLEVVALLPQLWLIARAGGIVDQAVSHHLALLFLSRLCMLAWWWLIRGTWFQGLSYTGWGLLAVNASQLLLLCSYMCYYLRSVCSLDRYGRGGPLVVCND